MEAPVARLRCSAAKSLQPASHPTSRQALAGMLWLTFHARWRSRPTSRQSEHPDRPQLALSLPWPTTLLGVSIPDGA
ncbi:hypothetical protein WDZ92_34470 [Nostoc sp. NIES-2111]